MKKSILFLLFVSAILFTSCSSVKTNYVMSNNRLTNVRYLQSTITGATGNNIILSDGSNWELDRRPFVNAGETAVVILFLNHPGGLLLTKNMSYRIIPKINEAFDKGYDSFFNDGHYGTIKNIDLKKGIITVSGDKKFVVPSDYISGLATFKIGDKILLDENNRNIEDLNLQILLPCKKMSE